MTVRHSCFGLALIALSSTGMAAEHMPHAELRQSVSDYLMQQALQRTTDDSRIEITVVSLDPRLAIPACSEPLNLTLNGTQRVIGRVQVRVQCQGEIPWSKFISASVHHYTQVLVVTENLSRGTILESHHLRLQELDMAGIRRTPAHRPEQVLGQELKQALTGGSPVVLESLQRPKVVRRGDLVQLIAESDNLLIRQQGEALQDGEVGKLIDVRNNSSDIVVRGVVEAAGRVKVQL